MNYRMILSLLGDVLLVIGAFLLLPCIVAVIYGEPELWVLLASAAGSGLLGGLFILLRPKRRRELHARDGFVMVALSWILISLIGAVPFTASGAIPSYLDAVFETMSGFTTTGASILRAVEDLPKCLLFWRSFTHWLGGMGVLVFMLAIVPLSGESIYLLRAESPGPSVSKMVPKMRHHIHIVPIGHNGDHGLGRRVTGEVIAPGHPELGGIVGVGNTPVGFTKVLRSVVYLPVPAISWQTHENLLRGHGCNRVIIDALQPAPGGYRAGGAACPRHAIRHNGGRVTVRVEVSINAPVFTAHTALNAGHTGQADVDEFGGIIGFDRLVNSLK